MNPVGLWTHLYRAAPSLIMIDRSYEEMAGALYEGIGDYMFSNYRKLYNILT